MTTRLRKTLESTRFPDAPIIPVIAAPGAVCAIIIITPHTSRNSTTPILPLDTHTHTQDSSTPSDVSALINTLHTHLHTPPHRQASERDTPFLFEFDHCFAIKGKGVCWCVMIVYKRWCVGSRWIEEGEGSVMVGVAG